MPVFKCGTCGRRINTAQPMDRFCPDCGSLMAKWEDNDPRTNAEFAPANGGRTMFESDPRREQEKST